MRSLEVLAISLLVVALQVLAFISDARAQCLPSQYSPPCQPNITYPPDTGLYDCGYAAICQLTTAKEGSLVLCNRASAECIVDYASYGASLYGGSGGATARFRSLGPHAIAYCESSPYCWVSASDTSSTSAYCEHSPYCQTFGINYVECGSAGTCSASSTTTLRCSNSATCMAWSVERVHCDNTQNCTINGEGSRYTEVSCGAAQSCGVAVNGGDADYSVSCQDAVSCAVYPSGGTGRITVYCKTAQQCAAIAPNKQVKICFNEYGNYNAGCAPTPPTARPLVIQPIKSNQRRQALCGSTAPPVPTASCQNGAWVTPTIFATGGVVYTIAGSLTVNGDLIVSQDTTLAIVTSASVATVVNVMGCLQVTNATLNLQFTDAVGSLPSVTPLLTSCVRGSFARITVSAPATCQHYTGRGFFNGAALMVMLQNNESHCQTQVKYVIITVVLCVVAIALMGALALYCCRKGTQARPGTARSAAQPYATL